MNSEVRYRDDIMWVWSKRMNRILLEEGALGRSNLSIEFHEHFYNFCVIQDIFISPSNFKDFLLN